MFNFSKKEIIWFLYVRLIGLQATVYQQELTFLSTNMKVLLHISINVQYLK